MMHTRYYILALIGAALLTLLAVRVQAAPATTYFHVSAKDVGNAVSDALAKRGAADKVQANLLATQPILYSANEPLTVAIQALTFDDASKKWQANMHIIAKGKTVSVTPISGRYEAVVSIPVLTRQANRTDVISENDIVMKDMVERRLRKDTVTSADMLIGKSPLRSISADRPIRTSEVSLPILVQKGQALEVSYSTPYMTLRTMGQALEDGTKGSLIRVKNSDSQKALSARVIDSNRVEANMQSQLAN
jgi:flagellar basal body P-ring formation protein FlgA